MNARRSEDDMMISKNACPFLGLHFWSTVNGNSDNIKVKSSFQTECLLQPQTVNVCKSML